LAVLAPERNNVATNWKVLELIDDLIMKVKLMRDGESLHGYTDLLNDLNELRRALGSPAATNSLDAETPRLRRS
jgi:hypothetical protein